MMTTFDPLLPVMPMAGPRFKCIQAFPSLTRPNGVLSVNEFAYIQRRDAPRVLQDLLIRCWSQHRNALKLTYPAHAVADPFDTRPYPDLTPLLSAWDKLCCWYRDSLFDRQLTLFGDPWEDELQRWYRFVRRRCIEIILDRPEWTRLILESFDILPISPIDPDWLCEDEPVTGAGCFIAIINANTENEYAF
jgi:hypothetical protein